MTDLDLDGRCAVVTGAAQGIGQAIARRLEMYGCRVFGLDLAGSNYDCDTAEPDEVDAAIAEVGSKYGRLDILVNNAGIGSHTTPADITTEELTRVLAVNIAGYVHTCRAAYPLLRARGGSIVNISSIAGSTALGRGNFAYSMSKAAVEQMTRELAIEWASSGIRVNAVAPSQVSTAGLTSLLAEQPSDSGSMKDRILSGIPLGRLATPDDVAAAAHFLNTDAASFITGVVLPVDGGNLALNAGGTVRAS